MSLSLRQVAIDTTDPQRLATWWAEQTGGVVYADIGDFIMVGIGDKETGFTLCFQRVEEPTPGKNRIHLDYTSDDVGAEAARLVAAGATHVADHVNGGFAWTVLADPDGNQFCVLPLE
ncbi:MAG: VOC family protein [Propionibacteriaceae bacterium]|jgi:predicted enzyme related to lactoylglutathione lyase|nr:VOC family protein [Propionibacteriaceae bacterium]